MKEYLTQHRKVFGLIGSAFALGVAVLYLVVVPQEASGANLFLKTILMYGHSLCWILLSVASFIWAWDKMRKLSIGLTYAALGVYILFIITLFIVKSTM